LTNIDQELLPPHSEADTYIMVGLKIFELINKNYLLLNGSN